MSILKAKRASTLRRNEIMVSDTNNEGIRLQLNRANFQNPRDVNCITL